MQHRDTTIGDMLRAITDADSERLVALVSEAYAEYPGCVLDLPGVDADLLAPATTATEHRATHWVLEDGDRILACVGLGAPVDGRSELKRLYVAVSHRRRGLASGLIGHAEDRARTLGVGSMELWSDSRFLDAHRLYERHGYRPTGDTRQLHDPSETTELHFTKTLV